MFSDYRSFGICEKDLVASGTYTAETAGVNGGVQKGFMHLNAIADATLTNVTFCFGRNAEASTFNFTLVAGSQLAGVASFTISAGLVQVLYFKS